MIKQDKLLIDSEYPLPFENILLPSEFIQLNTANDAIEWQDCPEIFRSSIGCVANGLCLHSI